jgi:hypothetical protein
MTSTDMHVAGSPHITETERISQIVAEARALELVDALADLIISAPPSAARHQAQLLLAAIAAGSLPEPSQEFWR